MVVLTNVSGIVRQQICVTPRRWNREVNPNFTGEKMEVGDYKIKQCYFYVYFIILEFFYI